MRSSSSAPRTEPNGRSSAPNSDAGDPEDRAERVSLSRRAARDFPSDEVAIAAIAAQSQLVKWAFASLIVTVVVGLLAIVGVDAAHLDTNAPREVVQTLASGEIGLIAGLLGGREK